MQDDFRLAREEDFLFIVSIFKRAIYNMNQHGIHQWDEIYPDDSILQSDLDKQEMYVLTFGKRIVSAVVNEEQDPQYGAAYWNYSDGKIAVMHRLCVDPDHQHHGIGKETIRCAEIMLLDKGYSSIRLDAFSQNESALKMYKGLGYIQVGEVTFRKGLFYLFEKRLKKEVEMIRHIVTWNYADGFSVEQNIENAKKMKEEIENLTHCIDGIIELKVIINPLSSSNADVLLNSAFESEEALAAYQIHPAHHRVSRFVGTIMKNRICIDYFD